MSADHVGGLGDTNVLSAKILVIELGWLLNGLNIIRLIGSIPISSIDLDISRNSLAAVPLVVFNEILLFIKRNVNELYNSGSVFLPPGGILTALHNTFLLLGQ